MKESTDVGEFDRFIECLPEDVVEDIEDPGENIRLIPIERFGKRPDVGPGESPKQYNLTVEGTRERMKSGKNAALYLGKHLVAIDVDQPDKLTEIFSESEELLEETLSSKTRSGGYHLLFTNEGDIHGGATHGNENGEIAGLRTGWEYILVPGCYVFEPEDDIGGGYSVHSEREPLPAKYDDLPEELKPSSEVGLEGVEVDVDSPESIDPSKILGHAGKTVEDIRKNDEKLDDLCNELNPPNYEYPSTSEADMAFATKLGWYEFEPKDIAKLFLVYRNREKVRKRFEGYLLERTIPKAMENLDKTVSSSLIREFRWDEHGVTAEIGGTEGVATLRVYKDRSKWVHEVGNRKNAGRDIFGLFSSEKTEKNKKKWFKATLQNHLAVTNDEFEFGVWEPLLGKMEEHNVLAEMDGIPPIQAVRLRDMIEKLTIYRSIDRYNSYPAEVDVQWNGMEETLRMSTANVERIRKVREEFLKAFGLAPDEIYEIGDDTWGKHVVSELYENGKVEFSDQEENTEQVVVREILSKVRESSLTTERQEAINRPNHLEYKDELIWFPSREVQNILDKSTLKIDLRRLAGVVRTVGALKQIKDLKVSKDNVRRFWGIDPVIAGVNQEKLEGVGG